MEYFRTVASTCMVFAIFILDLSSSEIELTTHNTSGSSPNLTCGSKVVFMCNVNKPPEFFLDWVLDNVTVSSCSRTCTPAVTPSRYNFSLNSERTEYYFTVDPLQIDDRKSIVCLDDGGNKSQTIEANVVARYLKDNSTLEIANDNTTVTVTFTTNCLSLRTNVVPKLKHRKEGSTTASYVDYTDSTPIVKHQNCTNDDNPHCGGNAAMRVISTLSIQTSDDGELHIFLLSVEENGLLLDHRQLGQYKIKSKHVQFKTTKPIYNIGDAVTLKCYVSSGWLVASVRRNDIYLGYCYTKISVCIPARDMQENHGNYELKLEKSHPTLVIKNVTRDDDGTEFTCQWTSYTATISFAVTDKAAVMTPSMPKEDLSDRSGGLVAAVVILAIMVIVLTIVIIVIVKQPELYHRIVEIFDNWRRERRNTNVTADTVPQTTTYTFKNDRGQNQLAQEHNGIRVRNGGSLISVGMYFRPVFDTCERCATNDE